MTSKQLALWLAILAGLQVIAGASALPNLLPDQVAQWVQLLVGAFDAGTAVYVGRAAAMPRDFGVSR
jgi:hypothetical protein